MLIVDPDHTPRQAFLRGLLKGLGAPFALFGQFQAPALPEIPVVVPPHAVPAASLSTDWGRVAKDLNEAIGGYGEAQRSARGGQGPQSEHEPSCVAPSASPDRVSPEENPMMQLKQVLPGSSGSADVEIVSHALWDEEAQVWSVVESSVRGLCGEAATLDQLQASSSLAQWS
jgi:hypothetical protein